MLHLYALFAEYIHILCIYTVYIRGTCSLSGGMCGLQHTERIHTAKTKSPGSFCEPSGPERVPGFVLALCAGKWPARRRPCGAQQFLLGLGQLLDGHTPAAGRRAYPRTVPDSKIPGPSGTGVFCAASALVCARGGGSRWSSRCTAYRRYTAPYTQRRALAGRTAQMRPLFFNT